MEMATHQPEEGSFTVKNWKDYVLVDHPRSNKVKSEQPNKYLACDAYICKFCRHGFTYYSRNGPRTITKHLIKHHKGEVLASGGATTTGNAEAAAAAAATAAAAAVAAHGIVSDPQLESQGGTNSTSTNSNENSGNNQRENDDSNHQMDDSLIQKQQNNDYSNTDELIYKNLQIKYEPSSSVNADDLDLAAKAATKQWKSFFKYNDVKTRKLKSERPDSKYLNEVYDCNYCVKQFVYCSRNGPGTLVKHLERQHLSRVLLQNPSIVTNSDMFTSLEKLHHEQSAENQNNTPTTNDDQQISDSSLEKNLREKNALTIAAEAAGGELTSAEAVDIFENECLTNLLFISKAAKRWRLHYTKNIAVTEQLQNSAQRKAFDERRHIKVNQESYICNYCGARKDYISRNGPKTLTNHLEKLHKKELLATDPQDLFNEIGSSSRKRSMSPTDNEFNMELNHNSNHIQLPGLSSLSNKRQKLDELDSNGYSHAKFHDDIIKILNENKLDISVVKSSSFRNLIQNLRPDYVSALDELRSLYSSFLQLVNPEEKDNASSSGSHGNNASDSTSVAVATAVAATNANDSSNVTKNVLEQPMDVENIAHMTTNIENSITQHNLLNSTN